MRRAENLARIGEDRKASIARSRPKEKRPYVDRGLGGCVMLVPTFVVWEYMVTGLRREVSWFGVAAFVVSSPRTSRYKTCL